MKRNWQWGRKLSEEHKRNIGIGGKGRKFTTEHKKKISEALKGRIVSPEIGRKISMSKTGKPSWNKGKSIKKIQGKNHYNWKGGITPLNKMLRKSLEYRLWRKSIYERDNYSCVLCGYRGNKLQVDHIKPWSLFPELRLSIDNGRTLCISCHRKTETFAGRATKYGKI